MSPSSSAAASAVPPVLRALRDATAPHHQRLEDGLDLLGTRHTMASYRTLLEGFRGFCAPAEERVARAGAWEALGLDAAARDRTRRLDADLRALGHDDASILALPRCRDLPALDGAAAAAGYLYVMEGATLGGAVISRRLVATLGITPESGGAFFGSYGPEVGPMWKTFTAALGRFAARSGAEAEIVGSACDTFTRLDRWLLNSPA